MANYKASYKRTAKHEGGYQARVKDSGNYCSGKVGVGPCVGTNHGVSAPTYKAFFGHCPTVEQMKALTTDQAERIFKKGYWDVVQADGIANQSIAELIVDWAYMSGPGTAIKKTQLVLQKMGYKIEADGKAGPSTLAAINKANPSKLHAALKESRKAFLTQLAKNPDKAENKNGWLARNDKFDFFTSTPNVA
jgi:lysozyme family protein